MERVKDIRDVQEVDLVREPEWTVRISITLSICRPSDINRLIKEFLLDHSVEVVAVLKITRDDDYTPSAVALKELL